MNRIVVNIIALCLLFGLLVPVSAHESDSAGAMKSESVNAQDIVLGHVGDSYGWHITQWGDTPIVVPLPVIVYSAYTGWHVFMSSCLEDGQVYDGFRIAADGEYAGKVVENTADGSVVRPFDISLTKNACALLFNSILLVWIVLGTARWYRHRSLDSPAPGGFVGMMEMLISMIYEDVIKSCVGKEYKRFAPYLLTVFFFIFLNNLMGLVPLFPGGANITGNIAVTFILAFCTFLAINLFGTKAYWKDIFWPHVPNWMKVPIPLMPLIELFGIFTKPFALMIRLFANILAGHSVILALTSLIFITASMGAAISTGMTVVSVLFGVFMNLLELLVAFIQAYVFTMLSAVFIGLAQAEPVSHK